MSTVSLCASELELIWLDLLRQDAVVRLLSLALKGHLSPTASPRQLPPLRVRYFSVARAIPLHPI